MRKIVFILNSIQIPRAVKRINSFQEAGYDCEVLSFVRTDVVDSPLSILFNYKVIGKFPNSMPYYKRLRVMFNALKKECNYKKEHVIFYFFGLDAAIVGTLAFHNYEYIYEEADLVHTFMNRKFIQRIMELYDRHIIRNSRLSVFTSEGFIDYHFGEKLPLNAITLSNKLTASIVDLPQVKKTPLNIDHLRIGFVGSFRYSTVAKFCSVLINNFPQHEIHVYGLMDENETNKALIEHDNFYYHGPFKNPEDLPSIYSNIDLSLSTYDAETVNARYAEPNKLYEAIFFETPIITSTNTFVANKVKILGIGFDVNASSENEIISFIRSLTIERINGVVENIKKLDKKKALNDNEELFARIEELINN